MSNRVGMPSVSQQGVKKSPGATNNLIRQLLTNGSRSDTSTVSTVEPPSDPESEPEPSEDEEDDLARRASGRAQLPRSALRSLVRNVLGNVRTSPDAINCLNTAGARFVLTVSRRASRICEESGRSLITGDDLLRAVSSVGCSHLAQQVRQQFQAPPCPDDDGDQRPRSKGRRPSEPVIGHHVRPNKKRRGTTTTDLDSEELQAQQLAMLMEARQADDLAAQQLEAEAAQQSAHQPPINSSPTPKTREEEDDEETEKPPTIPTTLVAAPVADDEDYDT